MMSENSARVLNYLKGKNGVDVTAADVAEALDLSTKQVNGIFTSAIQRKKLGIRVPAEVELVDGTHQAVKFLQLNEDGMAFDPTAEETDAE